MLRTIKPFISTSVALLTALMLVIIDFYFNNIAAHWVAVLWVSLFSAILFMLGQSIHATQEIQNYAAQLAASKERITNEIKHRLWAEKTTAESKARSQFIDENIPVMLAYFNTEQRCRYHNRIYRRWFGLKPDQIDGKLLHEFSNEAFASNIQHHIDDILSGKTIHQERVLKSIKGFPYIFTEQYIPHLDNKGKVIGFYTLHTPRAQEKQSIVPGSSRKPSTQIDVNETNNTKHIDKASQLNVTASRIIQAIEGGEFNLYCQKIIPIDAHSGLSTHYEILIRMAEEENKLMPPGSFLPIVNELKMMPRLDRWILNRLIEWLSTTQIKDKPVFCLNVASDTLGDRTFTDFVKETLSRSKIAANLLCFEIEEHDAESSLQEAIFFSERIRQLGCRIILCGFGQSSASVDLLRKFKVDYLKIDGSIVCNMLYDGEDLMRIKGINQIARRLNIKTIAELVESNEIIAKLSELKIDYAQGFGIAKPCQLENLFESSKKVSLATKQSA